MRRTLLCFIQFSVCRNLTFLTYFNRRLHLTFYITLIINVLHDWHFHSLSSTRYHTDLQHSLLSSISSVSLGICCLTQSLLEPRTFIILKTIPICYYLENRTLSSSPFLSVFVLLPMS